MKYFDPASGLPEREKKTQVRIGYFNFVCEIATLFLVFVYDALIASYTNIFKTNNRETKIKRLEILTISLGINFVWYKNSYCGFSLV